MLRILDPFADLKETVGRSFLVAGVAPASVALGALYWYLHRSGTGLASALELKSTGDLGGTSLILLLVALLLYMAAVALLSWVRRAPANDIDKYNKERSSLKDSMRRYVACMVLIRWAREGYPHWPGVHVWDESLDRASATHGTSSDQKLETSLRDLARCAKLHDDTKDWKPQSPPQCDLDSLSEYVERRRQAVSGKLEEKPETPRKFLLGQISAALDCYPTDRYGMDAPTMLPRLLLVIGDKDRDRLTVARANVECLFGFMLAASLVLLVVVGDQIWLVASDHVVFDWMALVLLVASLGSAIVCWASAPSTFRVFANQAVATIDTNRQALLEKFGVGKDIDFESENLVFQNAEAFFADGSPRWRPQWDPQNVTLDVSVNLDPLVADGTTLVRIDAEISCRGRPFTDRELVLRASRGAFASGEAAQALKFKVTGTRLVPRYEWRSSVRAYYVSPTQPGTVDIIATCGEVSNRRSIEFGVLDPTGIDLAVDKVEPILNPNGVQVTLRARLWSEQAPSARFIGVNPQFTVSPEQAAVRWGTTTVGDGATATAVWFIPDTPMKGIKFIASYRSHTASVMFTPT